AKLDAETRALRANLQAKETALTTAEAQRTAAARDFQNAMDAEKKAREELVQLEKTMPLLAENSATATKLHEAALREQTETGTPQQVGDDDVKQNAGAAKADDVEQLADSASKAAEAVAQNKSALDMARARAAVQSAAVEKAKAEAGRAAQ